MSQLQPYASSRQALEPIQPQVIPAVPVDVDTAPEALSLVGFTHLLRRRIKLVSFCALGGLLLAVGVSMTQDRVYRAEVALEIQEMNENFLNLKEIQPTSATAAFREDSYLHTQAEMLAQPALIEKVVKKLGLDKQPELISSGGVGENIRGAMGSGSPDAGYRLQYAVQLSKDNLKIVPMRQSRLLAVRYEARDPKVAANFANGLSQTFIEQSIEARWNAAQQIREWLRPQIDDLKGQLVKAEGELQAYSRDTGLMANADRETLAEDRLRSLQSELSKAQADRMAREPIYQMANSGRGEALDESPLIREHQLRLSELRRQMADLNSVLNPESYKVQRLQAQINEVEATLQKEASRGRTRVRDGFEAATKRERLLNAAVDRQTGVVSNVASRMVHYNTLKQRVETTREFYQNLLSKANEAGVASAIRPSNIRIVNQATPPLYPVRPNIPLNAGLGALAGLFLGFGCLFMSEHAPSRIRLPGDASNHLRLPELGAVPGANFLRGLEPAAARSSENGVQLITWEQRMCVMAESFRTISASLLAVGRGQVGPRVLVVTSSLPSEGKTTITTNLGVALAEVGRRVLLIDGDMRRPSLHRPFEVGNCWGLSDLLSEKNDVLHLPLDALVKKTQVPNLYLLPSGPPVENIAGLLYSVRLKHLLARYEREFDFVLIDSPPSLQFADARILGQRSDGAVLVVRADRTDMKTAQTVVKQWVMDGIPVIGAVLNGWDPRLGAVYGYHGYTQMYKANAA